MLVETGVSGEIPPPSTNTNRTYIARSGEVLAMLATIQYMIDDLSIFNDWETERLDLRSFVLDVAPWWKSSVINFTIVITNWLTITKYTYLKWIVSLVH